MNLVLKDVRVWNEGRFICSNVFVEDGILKEVSTRTPPEGAQVIDCGTYHVFPGFTDAHVHLREPGFSYKETMETGSRAAARGGFTAVITMPNLNPMPDTLDHLQVQLDRIKEVACVRVLPLGTITAGEKGQTLSDMEAMAPFVPGFSDDGRGVQTDELMKQAMLSTKRLHKIIVAHVEDERLVQGGVIHDGAYAKKHGLPGNPSASEWKQLERDIALLRETGAAYHACHVSAKESVTIIRNAKAEGLDITAETAPHYLLMNDGMLQDEGRFKMNPPIRAEEDRLALLAGLVDGTIDMVATDHAPHSAEEKEKGLLHSMNGIVGLETAFALLYHHLVKPGILSMNRLVDALHTSPNRRFGIPMGLAIGQPASFSLWDLNAESSVDSAEFVSKGKATPFEGWKATGKCLMTVAQGKLAYREGV